MNRLALLLLALPAAAACAQVVSLDGSDWLLAADAKNAGWKNEWYRQPRAEAVKTRVPWVLQDALPGYHGVAWYWREFIAPANPNPEGRYLLRFWAVNYKADVWVNGRYAGGHEGGEAPFVFDVTDSVKSGQSNRLSVRVLDPRYDAVIDGITRLEAPRRGGPAMQHGGIEDSVELIVAPAARLSDVWVQAHPKTGRIEVEATAFNASGRQIEGVLTISVSRKGGASLDQKSLPVSLKPGSTTVTAQLEVKNPALWSLESPNLYEVSSSLRVEDTGQSTDQTTVRTGFRDFRFEDGAFQLNGKKFLLRCAPQSNYDPIGFWLPYDHGANPDVFQRRLGLAKEMGFNMVRVHRASARRNMLDYADENGLLIYEECFASSRLTASPYMADRMRDSFRGLVLRDRNHPSVVAWGVLNEIYARDAQFNEGVKMLGLIRSLDPHRLVFLNSSRWDNLPGLGSISNPGSFHWQHLLGNEDPAAQASLGPEKQVTPAGGDEDVGDLHHYVGFPMSNESRSMFRRLGAKARKPVLLTEFGVGSGVDLETVWEFFEKRNATHLESAQYTKRMLDLFSADWNAWRLSETFRTPKEFFRATMVRSGANRLDMINAVRSNPHIAGFSHVSLTERPMAGQGMVSMLGELKPGMKEAMGDALAPVRFCLFAQPRSVYKGGKMRVEAVLANAYALAPGEHAVQLEIRDAGGKIAWERRVTAKVAADGALALPLTAEEVALDGPGGEYHFTARFADGRSAPGGAMALYVFDKQAMPEMKREVALWGEDERIERWLTEAGIPWRRFDPAKATRRELILASERVPAPGGKAAFEDLVKRIARGSSVVFLSEKVFRDGQVSTRWLPLEQKGTVLTTRNWLFGKDEWVKNHPVFAGLQRGGLMDYGYYQELLSSNQPVLAHVDAPAAAIAGGIATSSFQTELGVYHSGLMVAEYELGAGRFLVNTLPVAPKLGNAPQAERLLRNMLVHMSSGLDAPLSRLSRDFESKLVRLYENARREPPRIEIVVPRDGAVIKAGGVATINVRIAQVDTKARRVVFYSNGAPIGEDKSREPDPSGYSFIWPDVSKGTYELRAESVDEQGVKSGSQTVRIRVE